MKPDKYKRNMRAKRWIMAERTYHLSHLDGFSAGILSKTENCKNSIRKFVFMIINIVVVWIACCYWVSNLRTLWEGLGGRWATIRLEGGRHVATLCILRHISAMFWDRNVFFVACLNRQSCNMSVCPWAWFKSFHLCCDSCLLKCRARGVVICGPIQSYS